MEQDLKDWIASRENLKASYDRAWVIAGVMLTDAVSDNGGSVIMTGDIHIHRNGTDYVVKVVRTFLKGGETCGQAYLRKADGSGEEIIDFEELKLDELIEVLDNVEETIHIEDAEAEEVK